ncbi:MAG: GDP-mannose 4,6-dehydratase [candidate division WS6 bacterium GW2011_GWF2_39_15]|uniref:GDP-mannose 4,6-dehydratase n=1 Tax=candidate division WS6 bacterium GW2011_GWF2_39_15 TaxID=1619100 RepID=A0A0G0MRH3_9BACT|nr:MAG: GDP-mannose 4,6-dehydratase [candidate division WS6 bacterium GW2011_GWF2_39_15]
MKKALITGITGQDGPWLAKRLLDKGYEVYGTARRNSVRNFYGLEYVGAVGKVKIIDMDLLDYSNIHDTLISVKPDEVYNLAAQSFVGASFKQPISTTLTNSLGVAYILDIIKTFLPKTKIYQASTSELFGKVVESPQNERTPFYPRSPYAISKLYSHWMMINYRESYDIFATCGILFNHESELRGKEFVTRKITQFVAKNSLGDKEVLKIGNLNIKRDWGYAKDYVEGMYLMMQSDKPDTFVLSTGVSTTIRQFTELAFSVIGKKLRWEGEDATEKGYDSETGILLVEVDPEFFRPAEVDMLCGDSKKAHEILNWHPKTTVEELSRKMVEHDIQLLNSV